jgi:hypothetical protein
VPPSRPYWKGYLKLALVSCPVALYSAASSSERVSFRQINKKTGNRLRQQLVDEETREPVESHDKGRGYEYSKGAFVQVEDEELDAIALENLSGWALLLLGLQFAFQLQRMKNEERVLFKVFPEYGNYMAQTARLVPGVY